MESKFSFSTETNPAASSNRTKSFLEALSKAEISLMVQYKRLAKEHSVAQGPLFFFPRESESLLWLTVI